MLNDKMIRELKAETKPYRAKDAGGLFLDVRPSGSKFWRISYRDSNGKPQTRTIGQYPTVSLVAARAELSNLRLAVERRADTAEDVADLSMTFGQLAREWFNLKRAGWKSAYADRVWARIEADAMPELEKRPINSVTPAELLAVLRKMEARGALDVSKRLRQQFEDMWALAMVTDRATSNPASGMQRALTKAPRVQHHKRFTAAQLPLFFHRLDLNKGMDEATRLGLKLAAHVFLRTSELRFANWSEIDWNGAVWRVPAERMKMHRPHIVPLTDTAVGILRRLQELAGNSPWIFPSPDARVRHLKPMSENCLLFGLYRLGFKDVATVHGFRGTFSTIANESGLWRREWIEAQLAHEKSDKVEAAYNAAEYLTQRREMLSWYSDFLNKAESKGKALSGQYSLDDLLN